MTIAGVLLLSACDSMPDASSAQQAFHAHRRSIDAIDVALRAAVRALPAEVRCPDAASVVAQHSPDADRAFEECTVRRSAWRSAMARATEELRRDQLIDLLDAHHDVLGIELGLTSTYAVGSVSSSNVGREAQNGIGIEGYNVGWHLYQTAFAFVPAGETEYVHVGDGEKRPGLEVAWSFSEGETAARARVIVLMEGETDATWRAGHRRAASR